MSTSISLPILDRRVEDSHTKLLGLVQVSPDEIPGGINNLSGYLKSVKDLQTEFVKLSTTLSTTLIQRQAFGRAKEVRDQRHSVNSEVSEFKTQNSGLASI